jgi:hypothetical protein
MGNSLDSAPALIYIPDINGFTSYVSQTDIRVAKYVIPALLETILDQNELNFRLAEIQGDAILFYRFGEPPSPYQLVAQSRRIFSAFTNKLQELNLELPDNIMSLPSTMGIKIVSHFGKIALTKVRGNLRLIGQSVIVAHRLLKNSIADDEYLLMTKSYTDRFEPEELAGAFSYCDLKEGQEEFDYIGVVPYKYANLKPLYTR